ncbi:MAG: hypothetical protein HYY06_04315 [Deltaproteobacteria bacterium]|nr:hypothetical protein [Deltaproteobacteria bacterium]
MSTSVRKTLYVRGVPEPLLRRAKALAAHRGATLTSVVLEALESAVRAGDVPDDEAPDDLPLLEDDMTWYEAHKPELLKRHRGEYVAVRSRRVIDHDRDFSALARRMFSRFGRGPVYMPRCQAGERIVRLPSPRVDRR